jgi:hypothetical protein
MIAAFSSIFAHQSRLGDNVIVDAESRALRFDVGDRTSFESSVHCLQSPSAHLPRSVPRIGTTHLPPALPVQELR